MNTIKFYKNITTGLWHVDNDIVPSGSLRLKIVHDGMINLLTSEGRSYFDLGVLVTNIIKENGDPYESLSDFIAATSEFFEKTATGITTAITTKSAEIVAAVQNSALAPDYIDTTSDTIIYEGRKSGATFNICKIDLSTAVISRKYATGAWADRTTLNYL